VVWGLRASDLDFTKYAWPLGALFRLGAWLSPLADVLVVNSEAGRRFHAARGYATGRMVVIPNGIDTERFRPDAASGAAARAAWGVPEGASLVGLVARVDPMKGHEVFLRAAARLARELPRMWFACVGGGADADVARLRATAAELGIDDRVVWAGAVEDVRGAYAALEVATSASLFGEGFSNVVGEAMACGVPCVVTDVGDSAAIVGETGEVVAPGDIEGLVSAWRELLGQPAEERREIGRRARERIETEFSVERLVRRTEGALYRLFGAP
jgi:glycosyltransferase involved in cell wall biosynthesis